MRKKVFGCSLEFHTDAILLLFVILLAGHCNEALDPSTSKVHSKKRTAASLDASNCRYPLRSKQLKEVKVVKGDVEGIWFSDLFFVLNYVMMDDIFLLPPVSRFIFYAEHCNKIHLVADPSATKMTTTVRHHEKKTSASFDTSHCRYPLRNKQLKEVKPGKTNAEKDLLYVAQKAKRKKANNVKLEKGDAEGS